MILPKKFYYLFILVTNCLNSEPHFLNSSLALGEIFVPETKTKVNSDFLILKKTNSNFSNGSVLVSKVNGKTNIELIVLSQSTLNYFCQVIFIDKSVKSEQSSIFQIKTTN